MRRTTSVLVSFVLPDLEEIQEPEGVSTQLDQKTIMNYNLRILKSQVFIFTLKFAKIKENILFMRIDIRDTAEKTIEKSQFWGKKRKKKRRIIKFLFTFSLMLIIVIFMAYLTVALAFRPIIKTINNLPADFPQELAFYKLEEAKIKIQSDDSRQKLINWVSIAPDWVIEPLLNKLSDNINEKINENFGSSIKMPEQFDAQSVKDMLNSANLKNTETLSLSWDNVDITKEEMFSYYKNKLLEADFDLKENLKDYEIDIGFWKDDVFGTMTFSDDADKSDIEMIINYLKNSQE